MKPSKKKILKQNRRLKAYFPVIFIILGIGIIFAGVMNINTIREYFIGASGEKANIIVDTQALLGVTPRPWRNLAQGGEDKNWRIEPISEKVKALQPEYIRIDHIYDFFEPVKRVDGRLSYDFSKLDVILNDILEVGAKPYIALSYTPEPVSPEGDIVGMPTNLAEYQQIIQATIEHISKTRGIDNVMYEVWNEPDLFGGFKVYGSKNYLNLYGAAARAANAARANGAKPFKLGGPATTALYKNWIDGFAQYAIENNYQLDFISWHRYSNSVDQFAQDVEEVKLWIENYPQLFSAELHITEWGIDSANNPAYDSNLAAIHAGAVSLELLGKLDRAFVFEIQDGKAPTGDKLWGRWGLLTHQDFQSEIKPRYRMLQFLDRLPEQRVQISGSGTWVKGGAAKDGNELSILLVNYDFQNKNAENVPVTLTNIESNSYDLTLEFFDGTRQQRTIATDSGQVAIQTNIPMQPNSAVLLRATPK